MEEDVVDCGGSDVQDELGGKGTVSGGSFSSVVRVDRRWKVHVDSMG